MCLSGTHFTGLLSLWNTLEECVNNAAYTLLDWQYDVILTSLKTPTNDTIIFTWNIFAFIGQKKLVNVVFVPFFELFTPILIGSLIIFFVVSQGYVLWSNIRHGQFSFQVNYNYLSELEGEFGALEDYLAYVFGLILLISWFYLFTVFTHYFSEKYLHALLIGWVSFILITLFIPGTTLFGFGLAFSSYVRGAGKSSFILAEILLDFIAVSVIFIRFFIQNIRFVLIFLAFFELFEFMYLQISFELNDVFSSVLNYQTWCQGGYSQVTVGDFTVRIIWTAILYFYYVLHLTLLYLVQFAIYTLLSFWLFCFLFTSFTLEPEEKFFMYSRYLNDLS